MPSVTVYLTDEEFAACARLALPGEGVNAVLKKFAENATRIKAPKKRKA